MRQVPVFVEADVGMAGDHTTAAWAFDLDLWGCCGQGDDEQRALVELAAGIGGEVQLSVAERVTGDEQAFARDRQSATGEEREVTAEILAAARLQTLALLTTCPAQVLDYDEPTRILPAWARWRTLRQMAWHIADTESRYYLPSLGIAARSALPDLNAELAASGLHVRRVVASMAAGLVRQHNGQIWTTTKVLRRLAWHERSELITMHWLADRAARVLGTGG